MKLPLSDIDETMINELSTLIKNNSGKTLLYFQVIDQGVSSNIKLFARTHSINVGTRLVDYLKNNLNIAFSLNH